MTALISRLLATEPARLAEFVRVILVALVAVGWLTIDDDAINGIVSGVGVLLSLLLTKAVRSKVTPDGRPSVEE